MAGRLKDELPDADIDFYYMDIQNFGKGFPSFFAGIKTKINLIRSLPISIEHDPQGRPILRFESIPSPGCADTPYDLVVLSQGLQPAENAETVADQWGLDLDSNGFYRLSDAGTPSGVFVSGTCTGPMRIDECVEEATSVSEGVLKYLGVSS
jgi:heterodisulfide reductase subunit A-like polyferredoxin